MKSYIWIMKGIRPLCVNISNMKPLWMFKSLQSESMFNVLMFNDLMHWDIQSQWLNYSVTVLDDDRSPHIGL